MAEDRSRDRLIATTWERLNAYALRRTAAMDADTTYASKPRQAFGRIRGTNQTLPFDYLHERVAWDGMTIDGHDDCPYVSPSECLFTRDNWHDPILDPVFRLLYEEPMTGSRLLDVGDAIRVTWWHDGDLEQNGVVITTRSNGCYLFGLYKHRATMDDFIRSGDVGTLADYLQLMTALATMQLGNGRGSLLDDLLDR